MRSAVAVRSVVLGLLLCAAAWAESDTPQHLQEISVTIVAGGAQGSGVVFCRDGKCFVWTAAHVVDGLRNERSVTDPKSGTTRKIIEFADAMVVKHLIEDGRTVGKTELNAEIIRYSDSDAGEDLALLEVRKKDFIKASVVFYLEDKLPPIGTALWHCGSLLGEMGANSVTQGIMSQHGRLINKTVYDQTTVTAFPGSSGGGVYLGDGRYIGTLVRGAGEGFNLIVPVRRMKAWAKKAGVYWAMDANEPMPSEDELDKLPVEDIGTEFFRVEQKPAEQRFEFLISSQQSAISNQITDR